ncbi:rubrerythrin [Spirochaetia bacterium]|nr:rubrerythrin [Spirochaetia bacterium]
MDKIRGTETEKNLMSAFVGECQARTRYTFYASAAKKEGFIEISNAFSEIADQEKEHAKRFYKLLEGAELEVNGKFPAGMLGTTFENLVISIDGEDEEWKKAYPAFARTAEKEGFTDIAAIFRAITIAEQHHAARFEQFKTNLDSETIFKKAEPVKWICLNCGYVHTGTDAPEKCSACNHPRDYFALLNEDL